MGRADVPGYAATTQPAAVVETHVSVLFFLGDLVYKLRKPVHFEFLDFRRPEAREADCHLEVALNRRLAPDVYLGVAEVRMDGEPVDHMVVMRRMPDSRRLASLARQGDELSAWLRQVAGTLAAFHGRAARSADISAAATGPALRAGWEANFSETEPFLGSILDAGVDKEIRSLALRWVDGRGPLLDERIASGRVCDGHGDLQAEDIFCLDDGVRILDCIEFSDALRCVDVSADVAFLAMDLERLGRPEAADRFLLDYQELAGDRFPDTLVQFYCASRAYVRAKVCCLRSQQGTGDARTAASLFHEVALSHLRQARVALVLVGGLPGTGKSTLAAGLGEARDWRVLRSDEIRREVGGSTDEQRPGYGEGRYEPAATTVVYEELIRKAERSLGLGESVVLDASWVDAAWRDLARAVAVATSSDLVELHCVTTPEEADRRIVRRLAGHADISEATPEVREALARSMDPWASATVVDTTGRTPTEVVAVAEAVLDARRSG